MSKFIIFYNSENTKIINLINKLKLNNLFEIIEINSNNSHIYLKYLDKIPLLIVNNSNISNYNKIIEFIIRIYIKLNNKILPYTNPLSIYTNFIDNSSSNILDYSPNYYNYNEKIPQIETFSETTNLTLVDFEKEYKKLLESRKI